MRAWQRVWRLFAVLLPAVLACPGAGIAEKYEVVQVTASHGLYYLPSMIADKLGFFADEGVAFSTLSVSTSQAAIAAVISGSASYYLGSPATAAAVIANGAPVKLFGEMMSEYGGSLVVSKEVADKYHLTAATPIEERLKVIKGLKLAAHSPNSSPDLLVKFIARSEGLDPSRDLTIVPLTDPLAILASLDNHQIDGFALSSPTSDMAVMRHGAYPLLNLSNGEYPPLRHFFSIGMIGGDTWLQSNHDAAVAALRAIWRGDTLLRADPEKAKGAVRAYFPSLDPEVFDAAYDIARHAFPETPRIDEAGLAKNIQFYSDLSGKKFDTPIASLFTNEYADLAVPVVH